MSCCCCDPPDYTAMFDAAERLSESGSAMDRYWAQRFYGWVGEQIKPSVLEKLLDVPNPLHGKVIRWTKHDLSR